MAEHRWTVERRTKRLREPVGGFVALVQVRHVCSCGHATNWSADPARAKRQRDRHALEGQTSLTW